MAFPITTLETDRLRLRPFRPADAPDVHAVWHDEDYLRYAPVTLPMAAASLETARRWCSAETPASFAVTPRVGHRPPAANAEHWSPAASAERLSPLASAHHWSPPLAASAQHRTPAERAQHWSPAAGASPEAAGPAGADRLCGHVLLFDADWDAMTCEIHYWTAPWGRGHGYAAEAARAAAGWALRERGFARVSLLAAVENVASRKVADAAGFRFEGILRNATLTRSGRADLASYSLIPSDLPPA